MVLKIKSNSTINPLIEFLDNSLKNDEDTSIIMQHIASKAIKIPAGLLKTSVKKSENIE